MAAKKKTTSTHARSTARRSVTTEDGMNLLRKEVAAGFVSRAEMTVALADLKQDVIRLGSDIRSSTDVMIGKLTEIAQLDRANDQACCERLTKLTEKIEIRVAALERWRWLAGGAVIALVTLVEVTRPLWTPMFHI